LFSCASKRPEGKTEAEVLFKEAQKMVDDARYLMAIEKLNSIKSKYPYSFYATHAELLQADIYFKQENYVESSAAYILFKDFHPKHEKIAYVTWMIGESFFNQLPSTFDRDLSPGFEAIKYYNELVENFPSSDYAPMAREKKKQCEELIEKKDLYIADFYFRTEVFDAARFWYLDIIKSYSSKEIQSLSAYRVVQSSFELKEFDQCLRYGADLSKFIEEKEKDKVLTTVQKCKDMQSKAN
jgi:outer membrane protein assembly factor BamD